jgi:hypothetical protein
MGGVHLAKVVSSRPSGEVLSFPRRRESIPCSISGVELTISESIYQLTPKTDPKDPGRTSLSSIIPNLVQFLK